MFKDNTKSLVDVAREKAESVELRCEEAVRICKEDHKDENVILWHHRESERSELEKRIDKEDRISVFGSQKNEDKERFFNGLCRR